MDDEVGKDEGRVERDRPEDVWEVGLLGGSRSSVRPGFGGEARAR